MKKRTRQPFALVSGGIITVAAATVLIGLAPALPAAAHDYVVSSTPAEGETITAIPELFIITTNEPMLDLTGEGTGFGIEVSDENGLYYGDGCVVVDDTSMSTVAALGPAGEYTLTYQYVGSDGHALSDTIEFRYEPVDSVTVQGGLASPPVCPGQEGGAGVDDSVPVADGAANADSESAALLTIVAFVLAALAAAGAIITSVVVTRNRRAASDVEPSGSTTADE
jgi:methionine-rich copper-binding protein CopC